MARTLAQVHADRANRRFPAYTGELLKEERMAKITSSTPPPAGSKPKQNLAARAHTNAAKELKQMHAEDWETLLRKHRVLLGLPEERRAARGTTAKLREQLRALGVEPVA